MVRASILLRNATKIESSTWLNCFVSFTPTLLGIVAMLAIAVSGGIMTAIGIMLAFVSIEIWRLRGYLEHLTWLTNAAESVAAESSVITALAGKSRVTESPEVGEELQRLYLREIVTMKEAVKARRARIAKARQQYAERAAQKLSQKVRSEVDEATKGVRPVTRLNLDSGSIQDDVPRRD